MVTLTIVSVVVATIYLLAGPGNKGLSDVKKLAVGTRCCISL